MRYDIYAYEILRYSYNKREWRMFVVRVAMSLVKINNIISSPSDLAIPSNSGMSTPSERHLALVKILQ